MRLSDALRVQRGEVVAFVGARGKSAAISRLSQELAAGGWRVVATSTAKMRLSELADAVLIEADGGGCALEASTDHGLAIPSVATLVVPLIGLGALEERIALSRADCPELVTAFAGACLQNVPIAARVIPLLDTAETRGGLLTARVIACRLKEIPRVDQVLIGALAGPDPILERWDRVGALVLAAGGAQRLGSPKQLLPFGQSILLHRVLDQVLASPLDQAVLVLGAYADAVEEALAPYHAESRLRVIRNSLWETGLSSSIRAGLAALDGSMAAALLVLADQPYITSDLMTKILVQRARTGARLVAPIRQGQRGNPVLFDRTFFTELAGVVGDQGGRRVVARHQNELVGVQVAADVFLDIDTPSDYEKALHILANDEEE